VNSNLGIKTFPIFRMGEHKESMDDTLSVEEPLEISLATDGNLPEKVSITMRTPGHDKELAAGFLFTEGILTSVSQIQNIAHTQTLPGAESNTLLVTLNAHQKIATDALKRNFYTTSSCGVCGKASIDAIQTVSLFNTQEKPRIKVRAALLKTLPDQLRKAQAAFNQTGGIHASGLFDLEGNLLALREDVGRHNALDKVIGSQFLLGNVPLFHHILLLSGRASFELIQKAAMAGIQVVCAVGAPSSLAVETAQRFGICLIGFLKHDRFNIYTQQECIEP
jgi:FdhD protein